MQKLKKEKTITEKQKTRIKTAIIVDMWQKLYLIFNI